MRKQKITYDNYNGKKVSKEFYFGLNAVELVRLQAAFGEVGIEAGLTAMHTRGDYVAIEKFLSNFILLSYGVPSADGEMFDKSPELRHAFEMSPAYPKLYVKLLSDEKFLNDFISSLVNGVDSDDKARVQRTVPGRMSMQQDDIVNFTELVDKPAIESFDDI